MATQDLWGELPFDETVRTPVLILKEQAELLGQKTENILQGRVLPRRSVLGDGFEADLDIIAPLLDNYSFHVLTIEYPVTLYPVALRPDYNTQDPNSIPLQPIKCRDEVSFIEALGGILTRPQVKKVISLLIAQSKVNN
jgi:hypothetical protein